MNFSDEYFPGNAVEGDASCACSGRLGSWTLPFGRKVQGITDADLAAEMNSLSFQERQSIEEDIHGVNSSIEETEEFIQAKMADLLVQIEALPAESRRAWDMSVFLRPSLVKDRVELLMMLRARRFNTKKAAQLVVAIYEHKRQLWGDWILARGRVTWQDLSEEEKRLCKLGFYRIIPHREQRGRGIVYSHISKMDETVVTNPQSVTRSLWYTHEGMRDYPEIQRQGMVNIADVRGEWGAKPLHVLQFLGSISYMNDHKGHYEVGTHNIYDDSGLVKFIESFRPFFKKDLRLRHRLHSGSPIEIDYALRSFGIHLSDCLDLDNLTGPMSPEGVEQAINERIKREKIWLGGEIPYLQPTSNVAKFPNPQDIIMGRQMKKVTATWEGNLLLNKIVEQEAHRYIEAHGRDRIEKTTIAIGIIQRLQKEHHARFLGRKDDCWEVVDETTALRKVSQALRNAARRVTNQPSFP